MNPPIILAFMQNIWVRNPEKVRAMLARYGDDFRLRFVKWALFRGCVSGRRLKLVLGAELCDKFIPASRPGPHDRRRANGQTEHRRDLWRVGLERRIRLAGKIFLPGRLPVRSRDAPSRQTSRPIAKSQAIRGGPATVP